MNLESAENPVLIFKECSFTFIKDRRNGTKIYAAEDGKSFLRFGPVNEINTELRFHKHLIEQKYPVPTIIKEGSWENGERYYLETSAGNEKFGILFRDNIAEHGSISDNAFREFISIIQQYLHAQQQSETGKQDWESVFIATHFDLLLNELPKEKEKIIAVWEKIKTDLANIPFVLCHGDFNPHNILPGGVIDFETTFNGPKGYDLVSAATNIEWFPLDGDYEMLAKYAFTSEQRRRLLDLQPEASKYRNALFILRAAWSVVRMHRVPKLRAWRYAKIQKLMDEYIAEK